MKRNLTPFRTSLLLLLFLSLFSKVYGESQEYQLLASYSPWIHLDEGRLLLLQFGKTASGSVEFLSLKRGEENRDFASLIDVAYWEGEFLPEQESLTVEITFKSLLQEFSPRSTEIAVNSYERERLFIESLSVNDREKSVTINGNTFIPLKTLVSSLDLSTHKGALLFVRLGQATLISSHTKVEGFGTSKSAPTGGGIYIPSAFIPFPPPAKEMKEPFTDQYARIYRTFFTSTKAHNIYKNYSDFEGITIDGHFTASLKEMRGTLTIRCEGEEGEIWEGVLIYDNVKLKNVGGIGIFGSPEPDVRALNRDSFYTFKTGEFSYQFSNREINGPK